VKIFLDEISSKEKTWTFSSSEPWVAQAAIEVGEPGSQVAVDFELNRLEGVFVVNGDVDATLALVCSRCAETYLKPVAFKFSALFCQDPVLAGVATDDHKGGVVAVRNHGIMKHKAVDHTDDVDITYLSAQYIDLQEVLMEQLRLQIPFQPLCSEDCRGLCAQCGVNFNVESCQCRSAKVWYG
jgi:uncharacterized protein